MAYPLSRLAYPLKIAAYPEKLRSNLSAMRHSRNVKNGIICGYQVCFFEPKLVFGRGSAPDPAGGAYNAH